ncbi:MAG: MucB/RseB C-terminal domain-containing protein [Methylococcales bacterium]
MIVVKGFVVVLLLSLKTVYAEESSINAQQALLKTMQAMSTLNYQGTVAFLRNGKLETMKYFHATDKGIEQERLLSLNSPLREIVRDADQVTCSFKSTKQTIVDHRPFERSFLVDLPKHLADLDAGYNFTQVGEENIAMLPAYVIAMQPKDDYRYVRKIWIDKQQFLPLKVEVYDISGAMLEQFVFTELQVKDSLPFVDVKSAGTATARHIHQLQSQSSAQAAFELGELPPGFKEIFFARMPVQNSDQPVDHLLLSDGIASVSVYMENRNTQLQPGLQSAGAINSFSRIIENAELTVMGEVPAKTVEFIAQGIKLRQPRH